MVIRLHALDRNEIVPESLSLNEVRAKITEFYPHGDDLDTLPAPVEDPDDGFTIEDRQ